MSLPPKEGQPVEIDLVNETVRRREYATVKGTILDSRLEFCLVPCDAEASFERTMRARSSVPPHRCFVGKRGIARTFGRNATVSPKAIGYDVTGTVGGGIGASTQPK